MSDELSGEEIDEIRRGIDGSSPAELEARVLAALKHEHLLAPSRVRPSLSRRRTFVAAAIIAGACFAAGLFVGGRSESEALPAANEQPTFLLLLRESPQSAPSSPEKIEELVSEYSAWARRKAQEGTLVGGEKLDTGGLMLGPEGETRPWLRHDQFLGGYFVVRAATYDEALAVARSCPHVRHGGTIEIRKVEEI